MTDADIPTWIVIMWLLFYVLAAIDLALIICVIIRVMRKNRTPQRVSKRAEENK